MGRDGVYVVYDKGVDYSITRDGEIAIVEAPSNVFDDNVSDVVLYGINDISAEYDACIQQVSASARILYVDGDGTEELMEVGEATDGVASCTGGSSSFPIFPTGPTPVTPVLF